MKKTVIATTHAGREIWLTPNGHKLTRKPTSGAFTIQQAKRYDLHHPPEKATP